MFDLVQKHKRFAQVILFLLMDGAIKVVPIQPVTDSLKELGYPTSDSFARLLGWLVDEEVVSQTTLRSLAASGDMVRLGTALGGWLEPVRALQTAEPQLRAPALEVR